MRALYRLKSVGAAFRSNLADCMKCMGYASCLAHTDFWIRAEVRHDGEKYYVYILLYVDDVLSMNYITDDVLKRLDKYFKLKPSSLGDPDIYLVTKLNKT